ncbi:MAG: hypothetical protein HKM93_06140 [Desulfobacteraceae bacterium]|nr:hypothetical protein [Desulfobacteraceae bacterium]
MISIPDGNAPVTIDAGLHPILVDTADNHYLSEMLTGLKLCHRRLEVIYFGGCLSAETSIMEHARMVKTLAAGEFSVTRDLIETNWQMALNRMRSGPDGI